MHEKEISEIRLAIDALTSIRPDKSKSTILDFQDLLDRHLQGKVKKTYLKALMSELIVVTRETMPADEFLRFKDMAGLSVSEPSELIEKVNKRGRIVSDAEYRKVMASIDVLIQHESEISPHIAQVISQINELLAKYETSKKSIKQD
jgi:hypothetical protein